MERNRRIVLDPTLRPRLVRYFRRAPFTREDAEDLVQKTMLLVFQHEGELEREDRFVGWLYAIAHNVMITELARRSAERRVIAGRAADAPEPRVAPRGAAELAEDERRSAVRAAIERLPDRQRQCLLLRVRDELSYEEIASLLRLNLLTVRNNIAEAKKSLRRMLGETPGKETP